MVDGPVASPGAVSVVGSKGFIGRRVTAALRRRGHVVHEFDRDRPVMDRNGLVAEAAASDALVWSAATINPMIAENDPVRVAIDLETFDAVVRAMVSEAPHARILLLSSGGTVYDEHAEPPFDEQSVTAPRHVYGQAKLELERRLTSRTDRGVVLRVANAYGPGQPVAPGQGVVAHWMSAALAGADLHVYGDSSVARDYVHVDDIAGAVAAVVEHEGTLPQILNIGSGEPTTLRRLLETILEVTGLDLSVREHSARDFDAQSTWLDCTLARETIGWRPAISLAQGMADTWHALREQPTYAALTADLPPASGEDR